MYEAGAAQVRITPPLGTVLAGHAGVERYATGIRDHLYASAVVLEADGEAIALVSCDVLGISHKSTERIRDAVASETAIPASNVLVAATHTHTGPQTIRLFRQPDEEYLAWFERQVVSAVRLAAAERTPSTVATATADDPQLCHNRRLITSDGDVYLPTQTFDPDDVTAVEGPTDPTLGLLTVRDSETLEAVVVNYATHPELTTGRAVSPDYPGWLRRTLQSVYGQETVVAFLPGAIGNLSPTDYRSPDRETREHYTDPEGPRKAREAGRHLGGSAIRAIATGETRLEGPVAGTRVVDHLPTRAPADERIDQASAILDDDEASQRETVLAESLLDFAEFQADNPTVAAEVQAFRLGDLGVVTFPGEPFAEFGLDVRDQVDEPVFVVGCANDWLGYFPTRTAVENGGYETTPGWVCQFEPGAGDRLVDRAVEAIPGH